MDAAETAYGLTIDEYTDGVAGESVQPSPNLLLSPTFVSNILSLSASQRSELFKHLVASMSSSALSEELGSVPSFLNLYSLVTFISSLFSLLLSKADSTTNSTILSLLDNLVFMFLKEKGLKSEHLVTVMTNCMSTLAASNKSPHIVERFANSIASGTMPLHRMPFGLMEYQINFFSASHINQVNKLRVC